MKTGWIGGGVGHGSTGRGFAPLWVLAVLLGGCAGGRGLEAVSLAPPRACEGPARVMASLEADVAGSARPTLSSRVFALRLEELVGDDRLAVAGAFAASWMPTGTEVVTVGRGVLTIWDAASGRALRVWQGVPDVGGVGGLAVSADGRHVAWVQRVMTPDEPRELVMVDLEQGRRARMGAVRGGDLRFSDDGTLLLTGHAVFAVESGVLLWSGASPSVPEDVPEGCSVRLGPEGLTDAGYLIPLCPWSAWLNDGRRALELRGVDWTAGGAEGRLRPRAFVLAVVEPLGEAPARELVELPAGESLVPPRVFLSARRGAFAVVREGWLEVFRADTAARVGVVEIGAPPDALAISEDGRQAAGAWRAVTRLLPSGDRVALPELRRPATRLWDVEAGALRWEATEGVGAGLSAVVFSEDGQWLLGHQAHPEAVTITLDAGTGAVVALASGTLAYTAPRGGLALVHAPNRLGVYDVTTWAPRLAPAPPTWMALSPTGDSALSQRAPGELLLEGVDGRCVELSRRLHGESQARYGADGRRVMAWLDGARPTFGVWEVATGSVVAAHEAPGEGTALLWPETGTVLFEAWEDAGRYHRFDLVSGAARGSLVAPVLAAPEAALGARRWRSQTLYAVQEPVFDAGGAWMVDALHTHVRLWPLGVEAGTVVELARPGRVTQVAAARGGEVLFGGEDGGLWAVEVETGEVRRLPVSLQRPVSALAVAHLHRWAAVAGGSGEVVVVGLEPPSVLATVGLGGRQDVAVAVAFSAADDALVVLTARGARVRIGLGAR